MTHSPMEAASVLYHGTRESKHIFESLSKAIFENRPPSPSPSIKLRLIPLVSFILKRTTTTRQSTDSEGRTHTTYHNRFLERTQYPYALALLHTSDTESAHLVEGGDPMNGPYMMLVPEIRKNSKIFDKIFLDSVIGRDVQLRFFGETHATYQLAKSHLEKHPQEPLRMKAAAAGTGLSMLLVHHRLLQDGYDESRLQTHITDRAESNTQKTALLAKALNLHITATSEDILAEKPSNQKFHIITMIGILEYFLGHTHTTTEELQGHPTPTVAPPSAHELFQRTASTLASQAHIVTSAFRPHLGAILLETLGKFFRYRFPKNISALAEPHNLALATTNTSGHIFDVLTLQLKDD